MSIVRLFLKDGAIHEYDVPELDTLYAKLQEILEEVGTDNIISVEVECK